MKKGLTILLILHSILNMNLQTVSAVDASFDDVYESDWFYEDVMKATGFGLLKGKSDNLFNPSDAVSVAEAVAMAARINSVYLYGRDTIVQGEGEKWYAPYCEYLEELNISLSGNFNDSIDRLEFAKIIARCLPTEALPAINNVTSIPDVNESESSVYTLYNAGIMTGSDDRGTFNPYSTLERSEAAAIINRMLDSESRVKFELRTETYPIEAFVESLSDDELSEILMIGYIVSEYDPVKLSTAVKPDGLLKYFLLKNKNIIEHYYDAITGLYKIPVEEINNFYNVSHLANYELLGYLDDDTYSVYCVNAKLTIASYDTNNDMVILQQIPEIKNAYPALMQFNIGDDGVSGEFYGVYFENADQRNHYLAGEYVENESGTWHYIPIRVGVELTDDSYEISYIAFGD